MHGSRGGCLTDDITNLAQAGSPIEVDAGRGIEFVLNRGATLRLGQGRT